MVTKKMPDKNNDVFLPSMPDAYHKARRQLSLFSAILIFWEYVGIRIGAKVAEPTTGSLLLSDMKIRLENPEVIPFVIAAIVIYFAFRLIIEWNLSSPRCRAHPACKIDLTVSYIIAAAALSLFILQKKFTIRLADFVDTTFLFSAYIGILLGWGCWWGFSSRKRESILVRIFAYAVFIFISIGMLLVSAGWSIGKKDDFGFVWMIISFFITLIYSSIREYHLKIRNWFKKFVK